MPESVEHEPAPRVSVIIPVRNGGRTLGRQLEALTEQDATEAYEVIVGDNGSTDDTVAVARSFQDRLRLRIVSNSKPGASCVRNTGVAVASGSYILFCDSDDVVSPSWVRLLTERLETADAVGGGLVRMPAEEGATKADLERRARGRDVIAGVHPSHFFLPAAIGASFGVTREALDAVGPFDEDLQSGGTDVEMCWRLQLLGRSLVSEQAASVIYTERTGLRATYRQYVERGRSQTQLYRKFRDKGMPRQPWKTMVGNWVRLVAEAPRAGLRPEFRPSWVRALARCLGRVQGSIRYRVFYL